MLRQPAARRFLLPTSSFSAGKAAVEKAAKAAGHDVKVPFTPGRTHALQEQTVCLKNPLPRAPAADGFRNYLSGKQLMTPEEDWR